MKDEIIIRPVQISDAQVLLDIYRYYIEQTNITFEYTVPEISEWENRILDYKNQHPWLVAELNGKIAGYAYATVHRQRIAYSWCCESSVYLDSEFHGLGIAKILYDKLFEILRFQGYLNVYAILTSPNPKSERFHESFGFKDIGRFHKAGFKFDEWHDTRWMELHLAEHSVPPGNIIPYSTLEDSEDIRQILYVT